MAFRATLAAFLVAICFIATAGAASLSRPPPAGSFKGAPHEFTQFTADELMRGFLALAFGSDLSVGAKSKGIRRFDRDIRVRVIGGGSVDRVAATEKVVLDYAGQVPNLRLSIAPNGNPADITIRLIDEKQFAGAIESAFGRDTAREFVARTDPQCMTSARSNADGIIESSLSFVIVDQGDDVFLDCVYHELLHAFGLSNHDDKNPWTTLNQERLVGYLTVYDRMLLTLLYDPRIEPGMTRTGVRTVLPKIILDLGLAGRPAPGR